MLEQERDDALRALGWDSQWAAARAALSTIEGRPARVVAQHRDGYVVANENEERPARVAGRLRHESADDDVALPAVGDWALIDDASPAGDGHVRIAGVLPRRGAFVRRAAGARTRAQVVAANVDVALVVTALPDDLNPRRLERYLALAWESGALPVVVLSKCELANDLAGAVAVAGEAAPGVEVLALSAHTGAGMDALIERLAPSRTAALLGSSGVGKSTLVNALLGDARQRTAAVGEDGRGRHTTTGRELVRLPGGALLVDTPGMRELQLWSADAGLEAAFADVQALAEGCRFADCHHDGEPACAVRAAVDAGALDPARLAAWRKLGRELAHLADAQDARRASESRARLRSVMREARRFQRWKRG